MNYHSAECSKGVKKSQLSGDVDKILHKQSLAIGPAAGFGYGLATNVIG